MSHPNKLPRKIVMFCARLSDEGMLPDSLFTFSARLLFPLMILGANVPDKRLYPRSRFVHGRPCIQCGIDPVKMLWARFKSTNTLLVTTTSPMLPVKPLPDKCSVVRFGMPNKHDGMLPRIDWLGGRSYVVITLLLGKKRS